MSGFGSQPWVLAAMSSFVGAILIRIGVGSGLLRQRQAQRCQACGRLRSPRGCEHCGT
jgi:hypothetical protein